MLQRCVMVEEQDVAVAQFNTGRYLFLYNLQPAVELSDGGGPSINEEFIVCKCFKFHCSLMRIWPWLQTASETLAGTAVVSSLLSFQTPRPSI